MMQEYYERLCGHPPLKGDGSMMQKTMNFITVSEVIQDMGLEPTPELVSAVDKMMQESYERQCGQPPLIDKGSYYYLEECCRHEIEGFVRMELEFGGSKQRN
ncbi:MAG: hypothetical protein WB586_20375 [Chthoniobacterales bacterium]